MTFTTLFYKHIMFRHSCGVCHYTNLNRPSDITLADFWGWEKTDPNINEDDKGVSLIICNTEKGNHLFDIVKDNFIYREAELKNILQKNLTHPTQIHPKRLEFEMQYVKHGFEYVLKYGGDSKLKYSYHFVRGNIKRMFRIFNFLDRK